MDLTTLPNKIKRIEKHLNDGVLALANIELHEAYTQYSRNISLLFLEQKIAFREGNVEKAVKIFLLIQENYYHEELYKSYVRSLAQAVFYQCQNEYYAFFVSVSRNLQKELLINAAAVYEKEGQIFEACKIYSTIIVRYPEMITRYGPSAAQTALRCEEINQPLPHLNTYRNFLVQSILPQIFTQDIHITKTQKPSISKCSLAMDEIVLWFESVQSYYFSRHHWRRMHEFIVKMMKCCGFLGEIGALSDIPQGADDTLLFPEKIVNHMVNNPNTIPVEFEFRFFAGCFVQLAFEYYSIVSGDRFSNSETETMIIPVGLIRKGAIYTDQQSKKRKLPSGSKSDSSQQPSRATVELLMILRKASELKKHMNTLSLSYNTEFTDLCTRWKLPFDTQNAVDTMVADLCIMEGNPSTAITICRTLSARLKEAQEIQKDVKMRTRSKHPNPNPVSFDVSFLHSRWSKLFPFRVQYTLAIASVLDGQYRAAICDFLAILGTLPYEEVPPEAFVVEKEAKFRFKEVTTEMLVARSIHDVLYTIQKETESGGFDDTLILCRIVLSQFTYSYAGEYIQHTFETIAKNGSFTYPQFFDYVFVEDVLQLIHQANVHQYHRVTMLPDQFGDDPHLDHRQGTSTTDSQAMRGQILLNVETTFAKARLRQTQKKKPLLIRFSRRAFRKLNKDNRARNRN